MVESPAMRCYIYDHRDPSPPQKDLTFYFIFKSTLALYLYLIKLYLCGPLKALTKQRCVAVLPDWARFPAQSGSTLQPALPDCTGKSGPIWQHCCVDASCGALWVAELHPSPPPGLHLDVRPTARPNGKLHRLISKPSYIPVFLPPALRT